jgi:hypothetical protein
MIMRLLFLSVTLLPTILSAQMVYFHFTNGTMQAYPVAEIRKLTFVANEQVLLLNDGTQYTWDLITIGSYEFGDISTGSQHIASGLQPLHLQLYPNPAITAVTLETEMPQNDRLVVDVLDMQGRVVRALFSGERPQGVFRIEWNVADDKARTVAPGTYLVRLTTPNGSTTKPVVIH